MNIYKLIPGAEYAEDIDLLFKHTKTTSEPIIAAVKDVLAKGVKPELAAHIHKTSQRQIFRAIKAIQKHYKIHEQLNETKAKRKQENKP
jgi:hypothetical protein